MRRRALAGLLLLVAACTTPGSAPVPVAAPSVRAEVVRGGGTWTARFLLDRDAPAWAFNRSAVAREGGQSWRAQSWTILTPGVRLERRGRYDLLVAEDGAAVPRQVSLRFTPFAQDIVADYDPALVFTDGTVALYSEHFRLFPLPAADAAEALPADLGGTEAAAVPTLISFRDAGARVLHMGRRFDGVTFTGGRGVYILFGPAEPVVGEAIATVIDPALPAWLRAALLADTPRLLSFYAERLGPLPSARPTLLVSWAGPTPGVTSMGGSVLPDTVIMRFEGSGVIADNPSVARLARWFIAHEGAHFWLGQAIGYRNSADAWITEGGAELLAIRAVAALDPDFSSRQRLQDLLDECVHLAAGPSVASAQDRNAHRAYYGCGAMFALLAERTAGDFFTFVRGLIDAHGHAGTVSRDEWLAALGDPILAEGVREMVEQGVADPAGRLAALFTRAGVPHGHGEGGRLELR